MLHCILITCGSSAGLCAILPGLSCQAELHELHEAESQAECHFLCKLFGLICQVELHDQQS